MEENIRMKQRFMVLLLALAMVIGMYGCGKSDSAKSDKEVENTSEEGTKEETSKDDSAEESKDTKSSDESSSNSSSNIEDNEVVLLDDAGYKVTALSLKHDSDNEAQAIQISMENTTDKGVTFQLEGVSINGIMMEPVFSSDISAGGHGEDTVLFYDSELSDCGIEKIASIEFKLVAYDSDSFDVIKKTDPITLTTSNSDYQQTYDNTGETLYDENNIKVVAQGVVEDDIFGQVIVLYVENNSDKNITVNASTAKVNGTDVSALLYNNIVAGKKAYIDMSFDGLEDAGITDITDAEFSVNISDSDSFDTIADTDPVALTFE
jgi:hypothetical protein